MNTGNTPAQDSDKALARPHRRPVLLIILAVLLFAETALMLAVVVWLVLELLTAKPASMASAVAILTLAVVGVLWVLVAAIGALRRKSWIRGAAITWQLVQGFIAIGCFQGLFAQPAIGWALLIPAIIGILLVISPQVIRATTREPSA